MGAQGLVGGARRDVLGPNELRAGGRDSPRNLSDERRTVDAMSGLAILAAVALLVAIGLFGEIIWRNGG